MAATVAVVGADTVRFTLSRMIPGKPATVDVDSIARNSLDNPAYAVRYAHARAVAGVRWAAALGATARRGAAVRRLPADPAERALLDALSWLPERVAVAARRGRPDEFARYLEDLARATIDTMSTCRSQPTMMKDCMAWSGPERPDRAGRRARPARGRGARSPVRMDIDEPRRAPGRAASW